jgi:hypothetical protein
MHRILALLFLLTASVVTARAGNPGLQIINASSDPFMQFARVELNDSVIVDTLRLNDATAFIEVPVSSGNSIRFTALLDSTTTLELTGLEFEADRLYQSIVFGVKDDADYFPNPDGQSLLLNATFAVVDSADVEEGSIRTNFFHAIGDAVEMDVADLVFEFIVNDMAFGQYSETATDLPAIFRSLFFTTTDSVTVIASRSVDLAAVTGNTVTIIATGFIVPSANENGPVIGFYAVDQAGNTFELSFALSTPLDEILADLNVFPNPATDWLALDFFHDGSQRLDIRLTDLQGRVFLQEILQVHPGNNYHRLELPALTGGLYLLSLGNGTQTRSLPIVILR